MPISYTCDVERAIIKVRPQGVLSLPEILEYFARLEADADCPDCAIELVDFAEVDDYVFSYSDASDFTRAFQRVKAARKLQGLVFVCQTDMAYGIARMIVGLIDTREPHHKAEIIRSLDEAEAAISKMRAEEDN